MSVRCIDCGTILIQEAVPRAKDTQSTVDKLDKRLSIGYGGLAGFVVGIGSWVVFSQDETAVKGWLTAGVFIGTVIGAAIA